MDDPDLDEVSLRFRGDRMCIKWRFPDQPYQYTWVDRPQQ